MRASVLIRCMVEDALDREEAGAPQAELIHAWHRIEHEVNRVERS